MSHRLRLFITVAVMSVSSRTMAQPPLSAASTAAVADRPLRVAVYDLPPYGQQRPDGSFVGLSVDLWRLVSDEIGVDFVLESASMRQLLEGLRDQRYDAAIGAITITRERERQIDFSYPTHASGLAIATSRKTLRASSMAAALRSTFVNIGAFLAGLVGLMLLFGLLIWFLERGTNREHFHPGMQGWGSGIWWAAVTMTTVGYGDKAPRTLAGRVVAVLWMLVGIILISLFTATVTSILTTEQLIASIADRRDLVGARVGAVAHSSADEYLRRHQLDHREYAELATALRDLRDGRLDAVVNTVGTLQHLVRRDFRRDLRVLPTQLTEAHMGIGMPVGSPYRDAINCALISITASDDWRLTKQKHLGR